MAAEMVPPDLPFEKPPVPYTFTVRLTSGDDREFVAETCDQEDGELVFRRSGKVVGRVRSDAVDSYTSASSR